jgi:excisionase family DNA binding protein
VTQRASLVSEKRPAASERASGHALSGSSGNGSLTSAAPSCVPSSNATIGNSMSHSLTTAAEAAGINRSTVLRAIKAGKISATKDEHGEWRIEAAELHRVYPPKPAPEASPEAAHHDALAAAVAELRAALADMRGQRDAWMEQAQRLAIEHAWCACAGAIKGGAVHRQAD